MQNTCILLCIKLLGIQLSIKKQETLGIEGPKLDSRYLVQVSLGILFDIAFLHLRQNIKAITAQSILYSVYGKHTNA